MTVSQCAWLQVYRHMICGDKLKVLKKQASRILENFLLRWTGLKMTPEVHLAHCLL